MKQHRLTLVGGGSEGEVRVPAETLLEAVGKEARRVAGPE